MKTLSLTLAAANVPALDADLRAALGADFYGLTYDGQQATLILDERVTAAQLKQARTLVDTHDPARLTPRQQAAVLDAAKLDQARKAYGAAEIDLEGFKGKDTLLEQLAQKVLWLERELNALRSGL